MNFTLKKYTQFCKIIANSKYKTITVYNLIKNIDRISKEDNLLILRHDVDRSPNMPQAVAEIEKKYNIISTYYFRIPYTFKPEIIKNIKNMGHEIGLHYECLSKAKGNITEGLEIFKTDLRKLSEVADIKTICMHGMPLSKFDNRDIWKYKNFKDMNILGEAYLSIDFEKVMYYSDTGRTWLEDKYNMRDIIPSNQKRILNQPVVKTTDDLIHLISKENRNLYVLSHPERWAGNEIQFIYSFTKDFITNTLKILINQIYKNK